MLFVNLPTKLTVLRLILSIILIILLVFPFYAIGIQFPVYNISGISSPVHLEYLIAGGIFIIASFTDFLDGYIARSQNMITTFGKFADPIADKLLVNTMFILFAAQGVIPVVPVLIMIARDTIVDGCRMIASSNGTVVAAGYLGKVKTVSQMLAIILILLNNLPFELYRFPVSDLVLWFAAIVSFVSGVSYFNQMKEYIFESK